jgi:peptide/nickel transport system ATP-binding protein
MERVATDSAGDSAGRQVGNMPSHAHSGDQMTGPLLQINDLHTHFFTREGIVKAVDGATLEVQPGKTLGIVGESGCGKSITAKSILQIVDKPGRIVDGQILYNRQEGSGQARVVDLVKLPHDSMEMRSIRGGEISMIFQEPMTSFSPVHTVGNQIVEAIRLHRNIDKREATEVAAEWLRRVGIPNPAQRMGEYPYRLSGGQCQRAMIAMSLATHPKMLIADEPTTALDVTTQAQILNLLQSLQREQGMAMIFITHALGVIAEMADEVAVMYLGRVVEKAPVKELFTNPKHPYTQALMTSIPSINAAPRERLPSVQGSIPHPQNKPSGCPFHPRCPAFMPGVCDQKEPRLTHVGASGVSANHQASCFLYPGA